MELGRHFSICIEWLLGGEGRILSLRVLLLSYLVPLEISTMIYDFHDPDERLGRCVCLVC